jgi:hypothetical protein
MTSYDSSSDFGSRPNSRLICSSVFIRRQSQRVWIWRLTHRNLERVSKQREEITKALLNLHAMRPINQRLDYSVFQLSRDIALYQPLFFDGLSHLGASKAFNIHFIITYPNEYIW